MQIRFDCWEVGHYFCHSSGSISGVLEPKVGFYNTFQFILQPWQVCFRGQEDWRRSTCLAIWCQLLFSICEIAWNFFAVELHIGSQGWKEVPDQNLWQSLWIVCDDLSDAFLSLDSMVIWRILLTSPLVAELPIWFNIFSLKSVIRSLNKWMCMGIACL